MVALFFCPIPTFARIHTSYTKYPLVKKLLLFLSLILVLISFDLKAQNCNSLFFSYPTGFSVQFVDSSFTLAGNITSHYWTFGDGDSSTVSNPSHNYNQPGVYTVCLAITTSLGCSDQYCDSITIGSVSCQTSYTYVSNANNLVNFTSSVSGIAPFTYAWDFGDNSSSTAANPNHTYNNSGSYGVTLTVNSASGSTCSFYDTVYVNYCSAYYTYQNQGNGLVNFNAYPGASKRSAYTWDFGDGSPLSSAKSPVHTYLSTGVYVAVFSIYDSLSNATCMHFDSIPVTVQIPACNAGYSYNQNQFNVQFQSTASNFTSITYDFGDGSSSTQLNPSHNYNTNGTYTVCQTVRDTLRNCVNTFCDTVIINVAPPCSAAFSHSINQATVDIINQASNYSSLVYNFGDGSTSTQANPTHVYAQSGVYTICQIVYGTATCIDTFCVSVSIQVPVICTAGFTYTVKEDSIQLQSSAVAANSMYYDFGDGDTSMAINPLHVYSQSGIYTICQFITNNNGCTDQFCDTVQITLPLPCKAGFTSQFAGDSVSFTNRAISYTSLMYYFGDGDSSSLVNPVHFYNTSGTYQVRQVVYNNVRNCTDTYDTTISVNISTSCYAMFQIAIDTNDRSTLYLVNTSSKVISHQYEWDFGDGTTGSGRTPTHQYQNFGRHNICLTIRDSLMNCISSYCENVGLDSNGNVLKSSGYTLKVIDGSFIGIDEVNALESIEIFPNPFNDRIYLKREIINKDIEFDVMGINGRTLKTGQLKNEEIDLQDLPKGIYFLRLYNQDFQVVKKIIKN